MKPELTSIVVQDQDKALRFYTEVLGFEVKHDIPMGEYRWITVVAPDAPDGTQVVLEPDAHAAAKEFQRAMYEGGIPFTAFMSEDIQQECERLSSRGVKFVQEPTEQGPVTTALFDDTCGNLIQLYQQS